MMPPIITYLILLLIPGSLATQCLEISLDPSDREIHWKTNVTLHCKCTCKTSCFDKRTDDYRLMEIFLLLPSGKQEFVGEATNDHGNGSYVIVPNENATIQNTMQYQCMVSRVGVTKKVNFTVIEPPPIIANFNISSEGNYSVSSRAVNLTWSVPSFYPTTTHLTVEIMDTYKGGKEIKPTESPTQTEMRVDGLAPNRRYKFTITNYNKIGTRGSSLPVAVVTNEDVPDGRPQNLRIESLSPEELMISWQPPSEDKQNGIITEYETTCIYQCEGNCDDEEAGEEVPIHSISTSELFWKLGALKEDSLYSCESRAYTAVGPGPKTNPNVGRTQQKPVTTQVPTTPGPVPTPTRETSAVTGQSQMPAMAIGTVIGVVVVALAAVFIYINRQRIFKTTHDILKSEDEPMDSPRHGNYDKNLQVAVAGLQDPMEESKCSSNISKLEAPPNPGYKGPTPNSVISAKPPIPNVDFPNHVEQLHAIGNVGFNREYNSVNPGGGWSCEVGANNKNKNRYYNVKCFDHTRVKLTTVVGGETDFINANFVDGYNKKGAYIATQGPLPNTCLDFWRMVWEQKSSTIVMVTNLVELARVKCHQYYPESGSLTFGPVTITLLESIPLADFTIRSLKLEMAGEDPHIIKHFHFTSWPDHGVPSFSNAILSFVRHVKNVKSVDCGPIVVHCSAGVGRTGTFMAIDSMLDMSEKEHCVDIFGYVTLMRTCRPSMVQTQDQYIFIHDAILEALTCGVTEVRARDLPNHFQWLLDTDTFTNNVRLDDEFDRLGYNIRDLSHQMTTAQMDQNASKNRNRMFIPYDQCRVWLFPLPKQPYSNYINASYIDGFRTRKAYIATQSPLPQTVADYWRMVWELHSLTTVMLNREDESEPYEAYFPLSGSAEFGNIRVEFIRQEDHRDYSVTVLRVYNKEEGLNRTISHFQFFSWPEDSPPTSRSTLLEMITRLNKCQQACGNKYPVVVHCDYGMGRAGAFLALCICLERMKVENVVDVFQTVRTMRSQRPVMVNTTMLYRFIFNCLVEYLQTLDLYANIK
ncbi:receptor-type tyrosine-protein phosphatase S-like isoform X2 [Bolinopsis microptera]|uniref:receptor-type tyrosine-protein phosphatase S-like isoform X2 n=1 Tax=Bolinopsis microptera TaxID=2820187 RepID=UPI00307B029F